MKSNSEYLSFKSRAAALREKIGVRGKKLIGSTPFNEPERAISSIQDSCGSFYQRSLPALDLLISVGSTRSSALSQLLDTLKSQYLSKIDGLSDVQLTVLLSDTLNLLPIRELKDIPLSILKKLKSVPEKVLVALSKNGLLTVS